MHLTTNQHKLLKYLSNWYHRLSNKYLRILTYAIKIGQITHIKYLHTEIVCICQFLAYKFEKECEGYQIVVIRR